LLLHFLSLAKTILKGVKAYFMVTEIFFITMGVLCAFLSCMMITRKWPVTAAMLLVVIMMLLAGMYALLGAHFSAVAQIIVYAGAIMVIFVFVIMLLNLPSEQISYGRITISELFIIALSTLVALFLGTKIGQGTIMGALNLKHARPPYYPVESGENVKNISALMFTDYLWAFEMVSFLILAAIIGAIIIAKQKKEAK
ncbi:MAG: NADH-quinone oxidoreductase subunit J, partial [Silvanigrellaceae bacterium]|nr:NADH-quinone oxidoreductase subunit J [Silvanigrellaceae bacterium]